MPVTQRRRTVQLFRKLKFCQSGASSNADEAQLDIDKMILHCLDCLGALQCVIGQYDSAKASVFWGAVQTIAEIGLDSLKGHMDDRHPGATHLLRAFPNDQKATDGRSWLPLHWAAVVDDVEVKNIRKIARADPLATVKGFNQPISANPGHLISAVRHPNMNVVKCLYDFYPRMASSKDNEGDLPLHYAARYSSSVDMIRFLLQANPCATKVQGEGDLVPLQCALFNESEERVDIVKCLLEADPSAARVVTSDGDTTLHIAVDQECGVDIMQLLMKSFPEAVTMGNDIGLLPLHAACYSKRCLNVVKLLLDEHPGGAALAGGSGHFPAHYAAEFSSADVLKAVLEYHTAAIHEGCPEDANNTPLIKAITCSNEETVRFICQTFPETVKFINTNGLNPMHFAAENESLNILKYLHMVCPKNITKVDNEGRLPLHIFAQVHQDSFAENGKEADCLRFLLSKYPEGASALDNNQETAYSLACPENKYLRKLILSVNPDLDPNEFKKLNYESRRMGMFLAYAAINADGIPNIFCNIRSHDVHVLQYTLAFL